MGSEPAPTARPRRRILARALKALLALLALVLIAGGALWTKLNPAPPGVQVWVNARVLTMDGEDTRASAIAIEGSRIVAVGSEVDVAAWRSEADEVVDLEGRTVVPGFVEAHGHFPGAGLSAVAADLNSPPIGRIETIAQALDALRAVDARDPGEGWLLGFGYDDTAIGDGRHLRRDDLDAVSTTRPVLVMHISGHIISVNSAALSRFDIDRESPDPEGGEIGRDDAGEPDGVLYEHAGHALLLDAMQLPLLDQLAIAREAVRRYAAQGFTTVQNGLAPLAQIEGLHRGTRLGLIPLRVIVWPKDDVGLGLAGGELDLAGLESDRFHIGAVKLVADGSIQGYTGYLSAPYHDPGEHEADYRGYPTLSADTLGEQVRTVHCAGLPLAVHGNGDAAIDAILDASEAAQVACPADDRRPIIVHAQMSRADQLERMRRLGVTPSFFSAHVYYWGDRHRDVFLGPERAARISPGASARRIGLPFTTHLDVPIVPIDAAMQLWSAVARETSGGASLGPEERISRLDSLRAMTSVAAWQLHLEGDRGSIEPGKLADLVVLDADPLAEETDLRSLRVERTVVGGVTVYRRGT